MTHSPFPASNGQDHANALAEITSKVSAPVPEHQRVALVAEDSNLQRRILSSYLRNWGYKVLEAEDGNQALEIYKQEKPELVISDWLMPGLTGPELCASLREDLKDQDDGSYCYIILLTSKQEKDAVAEGLGAGADDFLMKPVNPPELKARISAGTRLLDMQRELTRKTEVISETLERLQEAYDKIDSDLAQARTIQNALVPEAHRQFGDFKVDLLLRPCGHVGGDLVGMFSANDYQMAFYNIDVSGHGITSAMMTARLAGYLNPSYLEQNVAIETRFSQFSRLLDPVEVAGILNARLSAYVGISEYFTMAYAVVDLKRGHVRFVQAGHPPPLVLPRTGEAHFVGDGGLPIGLLPQVDFDQYEVCLSPGDRLLLYSDGFTEAVRPDGSMLENEGFLEIVTECRHLTDGQELLDALHGKLRQIMPEGHESDDDMSAALLSFGR